MGVEPTTCRLRIGCSTTELPRPWLKRKDLSLYFAPILPNLNQTAIKLQSTLFPFSHRATQFNTRGLLLTKFHDHSSRDAVLGKLSHESPRVTHQLSSDLILASSYPIRKFLASNIVTEKRVGPDKTRGKRSPGRLVATLCANYANGAGPYDDSSRRPSIPESAMSLQRDQIRTEHFRLKIGCFVMMLKVLLFLGPLSVPLDFRQTAIKVRLKLQSKFPPQCLDLCHQLVQIFRIPACR